MAKTDELSSAEHMLDEIDPANDQMRDARYLRAIAAKRDALYRAEHELQDAVDQARAHGDTWDMIGLMLRTSKQNAHRKYGKNTTTS